MHFLVLFCDPDTYRADYLDYLKTSCPDEALIMIGRPLACRLLSKPRSSSSSSSSRQRFSQRHRSSRKHRRRQQQQQQLLLRLLLTMLMKLMTTYQSRYVLYTVDLNQHSFALSNRTFVCLHNSTSVLLVMFASISGRDQRGFNSHEWS